MKLTEEQLQQLKNLNDSKVNEILGITTLEAGKWYKGVYGDIEWLLIYNDGKNASGFWNGVYKENLFSFPKDGRLATREEIEEVLIKEAKKRGFKNVGDLNLILPDGRTFKKGFFETDNNKFHFLSVYNIFRLDEVEIFNNGKWADIIDDKAAVKEEIKQLEQRLKELRDELI